MEVFPDCQTLACTRERLDARSKDKATGRTYERLFIRHWDTWSNGTRSHLFSAPQSAGGAASATPVEVSKGFDADIPGKPFGGDEDLDRKSTRLNSSHSQISYAVFCLK